jgi:hypothetical protein
MVSFKSFSAIAFCSTMVVSACQTNSDQVNNSNGLTGTWQWIRTDGGMAANHIHDTPASTGESLQLTLTEDGKFFRYVSGKLVSKGTYTLTKRDCIHSDQDKPFIQFVDSKERSLMVERMESQTLELSDEVYDGITMQFRRAEHEVRED